VDVVRSAYAYKVLKSSWGIWISVTAAVWHGATGESSGNGRDPDLKFSGHAAELPIECQDQLRAGWVAVSSEISREISDGTCVLVEDVEFVDTDFQAEGLAVAMCRWAEQAFGFETHEVDVSFAAEGNRYVFVWAE
jgi:hypothetical protein